MFRGGFLLHPVIEESVHFLHYLCESQTYVDTSSGRFEICHGGLLLQIVACSVRYRAIRIVGIVADTRLETGRKSRSLLRWHWWHARLLLLKCRQLRDA
jgi:hypothetical protein